MISAPFQNPIKAMLLGCTIAVTFFVPAALAQENQPIALDTVVGSVAGDTITERDIVFTLQDLEAQFAQVPAEQRRFAALMSLIDIKLLAKKADADGLDDDPIFQQRLTFLRDRALHNKLFEDLVVTGINDDEVRARYDKEVAATEPENETRARHILLETEEKAKELIVQLQGGADFEQLAKDNSTGPSGPQGGDLGYFGAGRMVPEFDAAVTAMAVGEISAEPVKTQFGWHIIKIEDRRPTQPPAFEEVQQQIRSVVLREKYYALISGLRTSANIELADPALKSAYDEALAAQQDAAKQ